MAGFTSRDDKMIGKKVIFPENNSIRYGCDFRFHTRVPSNIEFTITDRAGGNFILRAPGYGDKYDYGNGAIYVSISDVENCVYGEDVCPHCGK